MKILYASIKFKFNEKKLLEKLKEFKNDFIATNAQYSFIIKNFKNAGLVLGCNTNSLNDFSGKKIIFVGDGEFHALIIKKNFIEKKVFVLNPKSLKLKEITLKEVYKFKSREAVAFEKLKESKKIGIIISSKKGQERIKIAIKIKDLLEKKGKKAYLFISDMINPDEFMNFKGLDVLVNTACPRLALDDYSKFNIPIINYELLTEYFNER